jgi:hypothetical protein
MEKYKLLIENLPYEEQAFIPSSSAWTEILNYNHYPSEYFNWEHGYSRKELFDSSLDIDKLIKILMWGYPTGGRGKHIKQLIPKLEEVNGILQKYEGYNVDSSALQKLVMALDPIEHLGRSTWSKLLYFCNIKYRDSRLLILDDRISKALSGKAFSEVTFAKMKGYYASRVTEKARLYVDYLDKMYDLAEKLEVKSDQLELFFFMFADILRL